MCFSLHRPCLNGQTRQLGLAFRAGSGPRKGSDLAVRSGDPGVFALR